MDADRDGRFKLGDQLWGINAEGKVADFRYWRVKGCNH
jgi:hypothetical protein